jgi:hypothetical protein
VSCATTETVESYFILWRLTHDRRYREWGWEAFQAIERHCRHHVGYAGLRHAIPLPLSNHNHNHKAIAIDRGKEL